MRNRQEEAEMWDRQLWVVDKQRERAPAAVGARQQHARAAAMHRCLSGKSGRFHITMAVVTATMSGSTLVIFFRCSHSSQAHVHERTCTT